jgi:hypothetical protein
MDTSITASPPHPPGPPNPEYDAVLVRLGKLERQRIYLVFIACLAVAFAVAGLLINRPRPEPPPRQPILSEKVTAEQFLLETSDGRRGFWGIIESNPSFGIADSFGGKVLLGSQKGAASLSLFNDKTKGGAFLKTDADNNVVLAFVDRNGKTRLQMEASDQGSFLTLWDKQGRKRVKLGVSDDNPDASFLSLIDKQGKSRVGLLQHDDGQGIHVMDAAGKFLWSK